MNYCGDNVIDHLNENSLDNRRENLKIATYEENASHKKIYKNNKTGRTGVRKGRQGKYRAFIKINGKEKSKTFSSFEEAVKQREEWEIERKR